VGQNATAKAGGSAGRSASDRYLHELDAYPILKPGEAEEIDQQLILLLNKRDALKQDGMSREECEKLLATSDPETFKQLQKVRRRLVETHLRVAVKTARRGLTNGWFEDLIQEANLGLMRAAELYDPRHNASFWTYAWIWAQSLVSRFTHNTILPGMRTIEAKKLRAPIGRAYRTLAKTVPSPTLQDVQAELARQGIEQPIEVVAQVARAFRGALVASLDEPLPRHFSNAEDENATRLDCIPMQGEDIIDLIDRRDRLMALIRRAESLKTLSERERDIFYSRILSDKPETLKELGERYGLTRERIRQIESRMLEKLGVEL
jgi:RNA polymerase sigma-32 factor